MTAAEAATSSRPLVQIAERANRKRAFLLVSTVLGKHLPVHGARCRLSGYALGLAVAGDPRAAEAATALTGGDDVACAALVAAIEATPADVGLVTVIGFAETATALGEQVATALDAALFQTTTRQSEIAAGGLPFDEAHSHAPDQWIAVPEGGWPEGTVVLVDDELTTGATACNLIEALHARQPHERYVVAALLDGRGDPNDPQSPIALTAQRLGVKIEVVALQQRPREQRTTAGWSGGELPQPGEAEAAAGTKASLPRELRAGWDGDLQHHGQDAATRRKLAALAAETATEIGPLPPGTLVLGTGEHLAFAQRCAELAGALSSSTTRSPVLVSQQDGYPIRDGLSFACPDDLSVPGFAYNVRAAERPAIVLHLQDDAHRARAQELIDALAASGTPLTVVTLVG